MTSYQSILLIIFGILIYLIVMDQNVAVYIDLLFKLLKVKTERLIWMIKFHPNNFITTWIQNRKYDKIAKELEKEFNLKKD